MRKIAISLTVAVGLSGCATLPAVNANNPITMQHVYVLQASYDTAVLAPAVNYRRLGLCAKGVSATLLKPCADRNVVLELQRADRVASKSLSDLRDFVGKYPGQLGASGLYDAAKLAINQAKTIIAVYHLQK